MFDSTLKLLLNYLFVQTAIILFMLPFYLVYKYYSHGSDPEKFSLSRDLENFFLSKQANWLVFFWALGEALFWFVIPEFLLLLMVFMRIRRKRELLVYDIGGTIAGTVVALFLHFSNHTIASLAYIQPKMVDQTLVWYQRWGILGLLHQPFSGVPYKVFTLTANRFHFFIIAYIVFAILVRMSRYLVAFGLFTAIYPGIHKFVYKNYVYLFLIATFIFSLLLLRVVNIFGPNYIIK